MRIKRKTREALYKMGLKAAKTAAQAALSLVTVGQAVTDINWQSVLSISLGAAIYSILMNVSSIEIKEESTK